MEPEDGMVGESSKCVLKGNEGDTCGLWGSTGKTHADCATDLQCMPPSDPEILGAPNKCVLKSQEGETCGIWGSTG